jgi:hypothetical protein
MRFKLVIFFLAGLLANPIVARADDRLPERIDQLINAVGESNCEFVRNGKTYSAAESVSHITKKYDYYKNDIDSIDRFIELSASKSMISGKPYKILCQGAATELSSTWLSKKAVQIGVGE